MPGFRMQSHFQFEHKLTEVQLGAMCGAVVHNISHIGMKPAQYVVPIKEEQIMIGQLPDVPILKMAKKCHVESFFSTGNLQLGSFDYYNRYDHDQIGDTNEGWITIVAKSPTGYFGGTYGSGYNNYLFCTYAGHPDQSLLDRFGYDSGIIIDDPVGFANAIASALNSNPSVYSMCNYSRHKAILASSIYPVPQSLSHHLAKIGTAAKFFIKPDNYSDQKEFRFTWQVRDDVDSCRILTCKEAIKFCRPL
jgi:hypothetical protein